jgi:hypothetical protein
MAVVMVVTADTVAVVVAGTRFVGTDTHADFRESN